MNLWFMGLEKTEGVDSGSHTDRSEASNIISRRRLMAGLIGTLITQSGCSGSKYEQEQRRLAKNKELQENRKKKLIHYDTGGSLEITLGTPQNDKFSKQTFTFQKDNNPIIFNAPTDLIQRQGETNGLETVIVNYEVVINSNGTDTIYDISKLQIVE